MSGKSFSHSKFFHVGNIVFRLCMVFSIVLSNLFMQTGTVSARSRLASSLDNQATNIIQPSSEEKINSQDNHDQEGSELDAGEFNYIHAPLMDAGVPDASLSRLEISEPVSADGTEAITLTATILDENSDPVEGVEVLFNVSGGDVNVSYQNTESDSNGQVIATVTSTKIGPKPVTAYIVGSGVDSHTVAVAQSGAAIFSGAVITGTVFLDVNRNGAMDSDESGVLGITVNLLNGNDELVASTQSVGDGLL